jgi:hypothetical protein
MDENNNSSFAVYYVMWYCYSSDNYNVSHIWAESEEDALNIFIQAIKLLNISLNTIEIMTVKILDRTTVISRKTIDYLLAKQIITAAAEQVKAEQQKDSSEQHTENNPSTDCSDAYLDNIIPFQVREEDHNTPKSDE